MEVEESSEEEEHSAPVISTVDKSAIFLLANKDKNQNFVRSGKDLVRNGRVTLILNFKD
jgi:hypothetical protein